MNSIAVVQQSSVLEARTPHDAVYLKWAEGRDPADYATVLAYFQHLEENGYRAGTIRTKRTCVRSMLRRAARTMDPLGRLIFEERLHDLERDCPCPKTAEAPIAASKIATVADMRRCMAKAGPKQAGLMAFLFITGARVSEATNVRLVDCKAEGAAISIRLLGKGKKERLTSLPTPVFEKLRLIYGGREFLFETSSGRPYSRVQVSDTIKRLTKRTIGRGLSAHKMRHSYATKLIADGVPISAVSKALGHADVGTTAKYYDHNVVTDEQLFAHGEADLLAAVGV